MEKKIKKVIDEYRADELGLPIIIKGVPIIEVEGEEILDLDYAKISELIFAALIVKPFPFTGAEVRFLRLFMGLTLEKLATSLHITHPTILSWEKCGNEATKMTETTEAMLRIFAAQQGAKDNELISVILNRFFGGPSKIEIDSKCATIVELDAFRKEEAPKIRFSSDERDLRLVEGA